jgi:predicted ArsR family transcriptional regulator
MWSDSSAGRIIEALARRGPMTIGELVKESEITITAVRQHVNRLLAEGWLERSIHRGGRGRPAFLLSISDQGRQAFATQFGALTRLLLDEIQNLEQPEIAKQILQGVGRQLAKRWGERVGDGSKQQKIAALAEILNEEGVLADVGAAEEETALYAHTCPYYEVADQHREICEMERGMIAQLVGGEVTLSQCMLDGEQCCRFDVEDSAGLSV